MEDFPFGFFASSIFFCFLLFSYILLFFMFFYFSKQIKSKKIKEKKQERINEKEIKYMIYLLKRTKSTLSKQLPTLVSATIGLGVITSLHAGTLSTTVGRYLTVENQALAAQKNLLQQVFQVKFPNNIKTNGQAMNYLLRFSGYSLVAYKKLPKEARDMMMLPLPEVNRRLGPMTLQDGLLVLAGKPFALFVDPVHRLISFRLNHSFQSLYQTNFRLHKIIF